MSRVPTRGQYARLGALGSPGCILASGISGENRRIWCALLAHGWVEPAAPEIDRENGLRITPAGLRALAKALEQHGYPDGKAA